MKFRKHCPMGSIVREEISSLFASILAMAALLLGSRVYLDDPIVLGPADNGLTLEGFPGHNVTLVGGVQLSNWTVHPTL